MDHATVLKNLGFTDAELTGGTLTVTSPIDGTDVAQLGETPVADMPKIIARGVQEMAHTSCAASW